MNGRITKIGGEGIPSVLRMNVLKVVGYLVKRFVPSQSFPTLRSAPHRIFEPVFVVVKILEGHRLRADVSAAKRVVLVTTNVDQVSSSAFRVSS